VATPLLLIVPGNPGDAYFYAGFADTLRARAHEVAVFDHARLRSPPASMLVYARHQAEQVRRYLRESGRTTGDVELIIVGHSVGAYVAHLIEKHALLPVSRVVYLFPFFARPSWRAFLSLTIWGRFGPGVLATFRSLPRAWQVAWLRRAGVHAHHDHIIAAVASEHASSYTSMGRAELLEIGPYRDAGHVWRDSSLARSGRVACLYIDHDAWSPAREHAGVRSMSYRITRPVSHNFVIDEGSWPVVASAVEALVKPDGDQTLLERLEAAK
jgi:pimeloyl-ACP methyl ester carboxylesterase